MTIDVVEVREGLTVDVYTQRERGVRGSGKSLKKGNNNNSSSNSNNNNNSDSNSVEDNSNSSNSNSNSSSNRSTLNC